MFTKILVAEDTDSNKEGVVSLLRQLMVNEIDKTPYCHEALLKIKRALKDNDPFDLLISDLSFTTPNSKNNINSGYELIPQVKTIQPNIKIIAFTVEDKQPNIKHLIEEIKIEGYVCKGIYGLTELKKAVNTVYNNQQYLCPVSSSALKQKNVIQLDNYEKKILELIANGLTQKEISEHFKVSGISPNSKSAIEKRINRLKDILNANTQAQMVHLAYLLDLI